MTAAVSPAHDRADARAMLMSGCQLGLLTVLGVAAFALLSRVLTGATEVVVQAALVAAGGVVFSYFPSIGVRPRTVDGIAWASMVGLLGALVFTVVDTAVLRPLDLYHWTWDAIGGGSGFWYIPVWWMGSAVLASLGALTVATLARGGREPSPLATGLLTGGLAILLFGVVAALRLLPFHSAVMALVFAVGQVLHAGFAAVSTRR